MSGSADAPPRETGIPGRREAAVCGITLRPVARMRIVARCCTSDCGMPPRKLDGIDGTVSPFRRRLRACVMYRTRSARVMPT